MNWRSRRGRIRLILTALLTALAVFLPAAAAWASPPNESSSWTAEQTANGRIQTPNAPAEAYSAQGNHLMEVWRGDDNHIYLSVDHGPDLRIGTDTEDITNTLAAPRVVQYGSYWAVFHTGIDGQIYWTAIDYPTVNGAVLNRQTFVLPVEGWQALPDTSTYSTLSPDVTTEGPGSYNMLVAYHSSTNNQLYSQWHDGLGDGWIPPQAIPNAFSASSPAVVWNQALQIFVLFFRGTDNGLYFAHQPLGDRWSNIGGVDHVPNVGSAPSVMALSNGDMQIAVRDLYNNLYYIQYYTASNSFTLPTQDSTHTSISTPPQLVGQQGNSIWTLVSYAGYAYWKLSMKENTLP